ncbi:serine/threonine-protein kinase [Nocardiopsis sp. RSe5-2]|uniref:Serine/threonine-protein kinase n=1 Tax=Nocardiopsis endophytica TaxID=3018445 RepID=A0ABT4TXR9_9ACTN|nr:serine/threonine-protein kinase [Nocardiopsis endophytica]MDA2809488.1 serine/threonine-protein kinase [Nocardiopsis endophytica]
MKPLDSGDPEALGPYRLVARIGAGGMGTVYAGRAADGSLLAVKTVHPEYANDREFRARFAREIALVRRVQSPYVPRFHGADLDAATPWLATEYVPGPTLRAHVTEHGPLDPARLAAFASASAEALRAIHDAGVVHRDLKPGNVILSPDGPKVLDFGIAHIPEETGLTRTGGLIGTPGWTSPERYRGAPATDRSDVFAWGGLVAYAGTGRPPFGTGNPAVLAHRVARADPDLDGLPPAFKGLVLPALHKSPEQRPAAADALRASLRLSSPERQSAADDDTALTTVLVTEAWTGFDSAPPPRIPTARPRRLRRPLLLGAAATAALVLGSAGTWVASSVLLDGPPGAQAEQGGETPAPTGSDAAAGEGGEGGDDGGGGGADGNGGGDTAAWPPPEATAEGDNAGFSASVEVGPEDSAPESVEGAWDEPARFLTAQSSIEYAYLDVLKAERTGDGLTFTVVRSGRGALSQAPASFGVAVRDASLRPEPPYASDIGQKPDGTPERIEVTFADAPEQGLLTLSDPAFREDITGFPAVGLCYDAPGRTFSTDYADCT